MKVLRELLLGDPHALVDINSFKFLFAVLLIHTIGPQTAVVLPGFVQGLVESLGFDDKQAGFIVSAEMTGMALATVTMIVLVGRVNWRHVFVISLLLVIIGNLASIVLNDFVAFCAIRFAVGVGSGWIIALAFAVIGLTAKADRNFGLAIMLVLVYAAVVFPVMPRAYATIGMTGVLIFFAAFALCGLPFVRYMPVSGEEARIEVATDAVDISWRYKRMALAAMCLYFVANYAVWPYLFRIGIASGVSEQEVGNGLAISQFFGIAGAFTTTVIGARFGRSLPLTLGFLGSIVAFVVLFGPAEALLFTIIVCLYQYAWNMTHPYLLGAMASFDRTGKMVVYATAMQLVGISIGPFAAALVIVEGDYTNAIWLGLIIIVISLTLIMPPVRAQARLAKANIT